MRFETKVYESKTSGFLGKIWKNLTPGLSEGGENPVHIPGASGNGGTAHAIETISMNIPYTITKQIKTSH